jgi:hypothetical protein
MSDKRSRSVKQAAAAAAPAVLALGLGMSAAAAATPDGASAQDPAADRAGRIELIKIGADASAVRGYDDCMCPKGSAVVVDSLPAPADSAEAPGGHGRLTVSFDVPVI